MKYPSKILAIGDLSQQHNSVQGPVVAQFALTQQLGHAMPQIHKSLSEPVARITSYVPIFGRLLGVKFSRICTR